MNSRVALITFMDGGVGPDNSLPGGPNYPSQGPIYGGGYPGQGLPISPGHPSQGLPGLPPGAVQLPVFPFDPTDPGFGVGRPSRPDNSLPGSGGRPDNSLPGEGGEYPSQGLPGSGNRPSNELPSPGRRYCVKWLACYGLILVPDNSLPENPVAEPKE